MYTYSCFITFVSSKTFILFSGANPLSSDNESSYYTAMMVASILAGVLLLAFIVVTGLYLKRTTTYKAIISGDGAGKRRKATFSNRAFKVGHKNSHFISLFIQDFFRSNFRFKSFKMSGLFFF